MSPHPENKKSSGCDSCLIIVTPLFRRETHPGFWAELHKFGGEAMLESTVSSALFTGRTLGSEMEELDSRRRPTQLDVFISHAA